MSHINSTERNSSLCQFLYKELEVLKIRIAFARIEEDEEALSIPSSETECEYDEIAQNRTIRSIHQEIDKIARRRFVSKTLPRALHVFAGIVLFFFLSLTVATAASHTVRVKILTFIINMEDTYTELSLESLDNKFFDVPAAWKGDYYPSIIPTGFQLSDISPFNNIVYYDSVDGRIFEFREYSDSNYTNIDTESSDVNSISINGSEGILVQKGNTIYISWALDNHFFVIRFDGNIEEAKSIADNVRMIH